MNNRDLAANDSAAIKSQQSKPDPLTVRGNYSEKELAMNQAKRQKRMALVTPRDGYCDGANAFQEIMERKRMRGVQHRENKLADYRDRAGLTFDECTSMNFADAELRRKIKSGEIKGGFAGSGESFPIWSPESVNDAWRSAGRGKDPVEKIQKNILRLARKFNLTSGLPKAVRDRIKKGGSGMPES